MPLLLGGRAETVVGVTTTTVTTSTRSYEWNGAQASGYVQISAVSGQQQSSSNAAAAAQSSNHQFHLWLLLRTRRYTQAQRTPLTGVASTLSTTSTSSVMAGPPASSPVAVNGSSSSHSLRMSIERNDMILG